jgi:putative endonuclease
VDNDKRSKGNLGEDLAVKYLQKQGYKILERNFHCRVGEIDIVVQDADVLVFVEVKTRWSKKFGEPCEAITPWKLRSIIKTGEYYKLLHPELSEDLRIDVVAVDLKGGSPKVELIKNVSF